MGTFTVFIHLPAPKDRKDTSCQSSSNVEESAFTAHTGRPPLSNHPGLELIDSGPIPWNPHSPLRPKSAPDPTHPPAVEAQPRQACAHASSTGSELSPAVTPKSSHHRHQTGSPSSHEQPGASCRSPQSGPDDRRQRHLSVPPAEIPSPGCFITTTKQTGQYRHHQTNQLPKPAARPLQTANHLAMHLTASDASGPDQHAARLDRHRRHQRHYRCHPVYRAAQAAEMATGTSSRCAKTPTGPPTKSPRRHPRRPSSTAGFPNSSIANPTATRHRHRRRQPADRAARGASLLAANQYDCSTHRGQTFDIPTVKAAEKPWPNACSTCRLRRALTMLVGASVPANSSTKAGSAIEGGKYKLVVTNGPNAASTRKTMVCQADAAAQRSLGHSQQLVALSSSQRAVVTRWDSPRARPPDSPGLQWKLENIPTGAKYSHEKHPEQRSTAALTRGRCARASP